MKKRQTRLLVLAMIVAFISAGMFMPALIRAGGMEPSASPGSTMHTLDEIYSQNEQILNSVGGGGGVPVEKTGQEISYRTGDDGDEEAGASWPRPRFTDNSDGTVTDNLTGLIWLKQANYNSTGDGTGTATWNDAVDFCKALASGMCGLSDGSSAGDWRLPNVKELLSLIHYGYYTPALPNTAGIGQWIQGDPFTNVMQGYWSSTSCSEGNGTVWIVEMDFAGSFLEHQAGANNVWPVRGGN